MKMDDFRVENILSELQPKFFNPFAIREFEGFVE
jgi:hypothetical protein